VRAGRSLWQWFRESRKSELVVIVGEDFAALLGLSFSLIAVTLTVITGNPIFDALGSVAIGSLLLLVAVLVGNEVKNLLIGEGVEPTVREDMTSFLNAQPEIDHVINFISLHMGNDVMIAVKVKMLPATSDIALIDNINACESRFREKYAEVAWLFFEPDNKD
jgi:divalent metal cation (Fe/Co/Zn/Cd) transporter